DVDDVDDELGAADGRASLHAEGHLAGGDADGAGEHQPERVGHGEALVEEGADLLASPLGWGAAGVLHRGVLGPQGQPALTVTGGEGLAVPLDDGWDLLALGHGSSGLGGWGRSV